MGQYRQWLQHRGIDQLLRSQLAVSKHELEQLQAQVEMLGKQVFPADNAIFRALIQTQRNDNDSAHLEQLKRAREQERRLSGNKARHTWTTSSGERPERTPPTISPALSAWSQLPNLDPRPAQGPEHNSSTWTPQAPSSIPEEYLLPPDIGAFIDAHIPAKSRAKTPHAIEPSDQQVEGQESQPVDQQSVRADHLVERWFDRWSEQSTASKRSWKDPSQ
ncbi:MAG: hypothetical protein NVS2B12_02010 [Ktedonobacteraceae bacterium]